jgi:hypothetical protein
VTFAPSCVIWATPTDGTPTLRAYDIPCPTFEERDTTFPTFECGEVTPPGSREIIFQDLESGLKDIFEIGNPPINQNVDIFIPKFVVGTRSQVIVTVNRINHNEEALIGLRAIDVENNPVNATICTIDAGVPFPNTPAGQNVVVPIGDDTVTFEDVTAEGVTTIIQNCNGASPPANFQQACEPPQCFAIETDATYSGNIEICLSYDDSVCNEADLRLLHNEGGSWVDVTSSLDTDNNIICGTVTTLSEFLLAIPAEEAIQLLKEVSVDGGVTFFDANDGASAPVSTLGGGALYRLTVTTTGTSDFINVVVNDAELGIVDFPVGDLAAGQTRVLTSGEIPELDQPGRCQIPGDVTNIATVEAVSVATGNPFSDDDPAVVVCEAGRAICDMDGDGNVDRFDVSAIIAARNTPASGPDDPGDADGDGFITVLDARQCVVQCTNPGCAP